MGDGFITMICWIEIVGCSRGSIVNSKLVDMNGLLQDDGDDDDDDDDYQYPSFVVVR